MAATATVAKTAYTQEQSAELVKAYSAATDAESRKAIIEAFAVKFGKTAKSIIAKLSREGAYVKAERTRKDGTTVEKKDATADAIGAILRLSEADTSSLTKANRSALQAIFKALANSKPLE